MWIDLILPLIYCTTGFLAGYLVFRRPTNSVSPGSDSNSASEQSVEREQSLKETTERLRQFARSLAADVDAHQTKVQSVNSSLHEATEDLSGDVIFLAVNRLIEANETMQRQLQSAQDQIQSQSNLLESAERRAMTDALTRISNRRALDDFMNRQFAKGSDHASTLALLDVDHFKKFNDQHGHRAGDEVLRAVAGLINSQLASYGIVARYGGEEFAVVLDGCTVKQSIPIIDATRAAIGVREILFENKRLHVTASVGIAQLTAEDTLASWIQRADECLYQSKNNGRNTGYWADGSDYMPINTSPVTEPTDETSISPDSTTTVDSTNLPSSGVSPTGVRERTSLQPADQAAPLVNPFPYLPNRVTLIESLNEIADHVRVSRTPLSILAIRLGNQVSSVASRSLLQMVRGKLRSTDYIGCDGASTLIVCSPNVGVEMSTERAHQIHQSASSVLATTTDPTQQSHITIGVLQWDTDDTLDQAIEGAIELTIEVAREPVRVRQLTSRS